MMKTAGFRVAAIAAIANSPLSQCLEFGDSVPTCTGCGALTVSVDFDNGRILVGAREAGASQSGAAYVYERAGAEWVITATLLPDDASSFMFFGKAVALQGARAYVAAEGTGGNSLSGLYEFEEGPTGWVQSYKFPIGSNYRPQAVAVDGTSLVVGSNGGVTFFDSDTGSWVLSAETGGTPDPGQVGQTSFGSALDLKDGTAVIGAKWEDTVLGPKANAAGAVYIYGRSGGTWTLDTKLLGAGGVNNFFGASVSLDGSRVLASSGSNSAELYEKFVFGWYLTTTLSAGTGPVQVNGDRALVGGTLLEEIKGSWQSMTYFDEFDASRLTDEGLVVSTASTGSVGSLMVYSIEDLGQQFQGCPHDVSASDFVQQALVIDPGVEFGGDPFLVVGSLSGVSPGIDLGPVHIPLNPDSYLIFSVSNANNGLPFLNSFGPLSDAGTASSWLTFPPGTLSGFAGATFHHTFLVLDLDIPAVVHAGNGVAMSVH